jgi:choline kinase
MKPTLVILAAGMASRYGSMKQVQGFGPDNETIMDYSIYDAIRSGFGKIVFIIRRDFAEDFKNIFEPKLKDRVETAYVYQDMHAYMNGFEVPANRLKPWGTAHALLCADDAVSEPFAVINADDFYGADAFMRAYEFLSRDVRKDKYAIIGYQLANTLSEHGSVSRGVCDVDSKGFLTSINERTKIYRDQGKIVYEEGEKKAILADDSRVSMNFWCFHESVFDHAEKMFHDFLREKKDDPKAEFFIPIVGDRFINEEKGKILVIPTDAAWFGVTYKEDAPGVEKNIASLVRNGSYPEKLWN